MPTPDQQEVDRDVTRALAEDVGSGDLTAALIPEEERMLAAFICREAATLCGFAWAEAAFRQVDADIACEWEVRDGDVVSANTVFGRVEGPARGILTAERTALNFLQTLSGTATAASRYASAVADTEATVLDTRKTLPGLRYAQKYAVRCGGATNHRLGLFDAYLIKENHIGAAGSIGAAVAKARAAGPPTALLEVEVETLAQLEEAVAAGVDRVLVDNFDLETLDAAVSAYGDRVDLEASGGITLESIGAVAATGVDYISIGAITKHVRAVDLSLRIQS